MFHLMTVLALAVHGAAAPAAPSARPSTIARAAVTAVVPDDDGGGASVEARIARGDSLVFAGRIGAGTDLLRSVIDEQRAAGQYARDALWHLASAYFLVDDRAQTAHTLDHLADEAAQFGDPQMELQASFEAARLHAQLGEGARARDRAARVLALLQSPAIPDAVKDDFRARIAGAP